MTFKLNQRTLSRRRYGSTTSFSVSSVSGPALPRPWRNTGAGGAFEFYGNTSSYIQYQNNGEFNFGYGDFTIEWWQYETDTNGAPRPWAFGPWPQTQLGVSMEGNIYLWVDGGSTSFTPVSPIKDATNHFALVKTGGYIYMYQNGIDLGSPYYVGSLGFNMSYPLTIGSESGQYDSQCFAGTITNFNIVNYAKYTAPFTVTNTALTFDWTTNIFLAPFDNGQQGATPVGPYFDSNNPNQTYVGNASWVNVSPFKFPHPEFPVLPVVSGGVLGSDTTYFYRAFPYSDTLTVSNAPLVADVLLVGGGGSGGVSGFYVMQNSVSGGGGAGDFLLSEQVSLSPDTYIASVGGGASGVYAGNYSASSGNSGSPSSLLNANTLAVVSNLTASGGGYGENAYPGKGGDSGTRLGGAGALATLGYPSGGGGAGAGQPGNSATPDYRTAGAGPGGDGTDAFASWLTPLGMGVDDGTGNIYFGGGGGGTQQFNWYSGPGSTYVSGGKGGGGLGFSKYGGGWPELNVAANTGSGSGGTANNYQSGNGGSGFIIFRYLKTAVAS